MYMPKHIYHHHSPLPDFVCGREAGCQNQLFSRESQGLSYPPKGTYGAPIADTHDRKEGSQVPIDTQVCPKGLTLLDQGLRGCFSKKKKEILCSFSSSSYSTSQTEMPGKKINKTKLKAANEFPSETLRKPPKLNWMLLWAWVQINMTIQSWKHLRCPYGRKKGRSWYLPPAEWYKDFLFWFLPQTLSATKKEAKLRHQR